ncbi:MAG: YidC/Oxa1 family insertase periplasmic-domain containing protein [Myxococcota bacterium]
MTQTVRILMLAAVLFVATASDASLGRAAEGVEAAPTQGAAPAGDLPVAVSPTVLPSAAAVALPAAATPVEAMAPARFVAPPCRPGAVGVELKSSLAQWTISPCRGGLQSVRLTDPQFALRAREAPAGVAPWAKDKFAAGPLDLVDTWDARWDPFRVELEAVSPNPVTLQIRDEVGQVRPLGQVDLATFVKQDGRFGVVSQSDREVVLVWPDPSRIQSPVYVQKRYRLADAANPYSLRYEVAIWNLGPLPVKFRVAHEVTSFQPTHHESGGFFAIFAGLPDVKGAGYYVGGKRYRHDATAIPKADLEDRQHGGVPSWFGVDSRYFLVAAAPVAGQAPQSLVHLSWLANGVILSGLRGAGDALLGASSACVPEWYAKTWGGNSCRADLDTLGLKASAEETALDAKTLEPSVTAARNNGIEVAVLTAAEARLRGRQVQSQALDLYTGPKDVNYLETAGHDLVKSIDFGWFAVIARPMLAVLQFAHGLFGSWPLAILMLTLLVKLLLWPITGKSIKSMRKMQELKPELDALRKDLEAKAKKLGQDKADPQELNRLTFELYKKHSVNPLGGCLPMLLQLPVYIALYRTISASVELYNQPLFGWVTDLTQKDPYFVLPLLLGAVMFVQQKITPQTAGDPMQQKMMLYFMPALFTLMMLQLPSGLTLYILANTLLSIIQTKLSASRPTVASAVK